MFCMDLAINSDCFLKPREAIGLLKLRSKILSVRCEIRYTFFSVMSNHWVIGPRRLDTSSKVKCLILGLVALENGTN